MSKNCLGTVSQRTIRICQQRTVLVSQEESRSDSIYTQTVTEFQSQFASHIFSEVSNSSFCSSVTNHTCQRTKSRFGTEVYDRTFLLFYHDFSKYHCRQYCTKQIQIHYFLKGINLQVKESFVRSNCCACHITSGSVQQYVNTSIGFHDLHFVTFQHFFVHYVRIQEHSFISFSFDTFYQCLTCFFASIEYNNFSSFFS